MRIAALDIGGTSIKSGIWDGKEAAELREWETRAAEGGERLMERAEEILRFCRPFDAIGISTAGQVDIRTGVICYANENIPRYTGVPVRDRMERAFGVPVAVENDGKAAALGELYCGAGRGLTDFLMLTYGTGIGGAIVSGGQVLRGADHAAGSFGCILTHPELVRDDDCYAGCYEMHASTGALVRRVIRIDPALDDGRRIFAALSRKDVRAEVDAWLDEIAWGLLSLIHSINPSDLVLGGGILEQAYVLDGIRSRVERLVIENMRGVRLHRAALGNRAGLTGAAVLAQKLL